MPHGTCKDFASVLRKTFRIATSEATGATGDKQDGWCHGQPLLSWRLSRILGAAPERQPAPFSPSGLRFLQGLWRKKCGCLPRSRACTLVRLCFYGSCRPNRSSPTCEGAPAREAATCSHGTRWMWSAGESRRMRLLGPMTTEGKDQEWSTLSSAASSG